MKAKRKIYVPEFKSQRIIRNSEEHSFRDEITIDFNKFDISEYGSLCFAEISLKKIHIINLNLPDNIKVDINIELPEGIRFKGNSMKYEDGSNFKKIMETEIETIIKTRGDFFVTDVSTYNIIKTNYNTENDKIGYLYVEYKPHNGNPKKIDPKELELKVACEYISNKYNKNNKNKIGTNACSIL